MEHLGSAKDGHVLKLSLANSGAVVGDDNELGLSVSEHLHDGLVAYGLKEGAKLEKSVSCRRNKILTNSVLSGADSETQLLVSVLGGLSLLSHCANTAKRVRSITNRDTANRVRSPRATPN